MKSTWPLPQVILVGLELNQQGHAASHEQASSSWPVIFHGVLSLDSSAPRREAPTQRRPATSAYGKRDVVSMVRNFNGHTRSEQINFVVGACCSRRPAGDAMRGWFIRQRSASHSKAGYRKNQRVTRLELATSSLARRCSTTELHPQFRGK